MVTGIGLGLDRGPLVLTLYVLSLNPSLILVSENQSKGASCNAPSLGSLVIDVDRKRPVVIVPDSSLCVELPLVP